MKKQQFEKLIKFYQDWFSLRGHKNKVKLDLDKYYDYHCNLQKWWEEDAISYIVNMLDRINDLPEEQIEKKMRWLGFIQGTMWALGMFSINEMKEHNRDNSNE